MTKLALSKPVSLFILAAGLCLAGVLAFVFMPVELMPNNSSGMITVTTPVRGGMAPTEVEQQVTKLVEDAVASVGQVRSVVSKSKQGESVVSIEFEPGTNMDFATLEVREKISRIKGGLPREIESPIIAHYRESDVPVFIFAFTSQTKSPEELRALVDTGLKEKLLRIKGVANVDVAGGRERKIIVDVDRFKLMSHGMDIRRVVQSIEQANLNIKAGVVRSDAFESTIRAVGQFANVDEINGTVIGMSPQGSLLHVRDIAHVRDSYLEQESLSRLNAHSAVTVYIQKESAANTVQVVKKAHVVVAAFQSKFTGSDMAYRDIAYLEISDQGKAIRAAVGSVQLALALGIVLVVVVLGLFLGRKPSLVVAVSIPVVTLTVGVVMFLGHLTLNVMTLSGLALGIGLLVDNSIVVLEAILRRGARSIQETTESIAGAIAGGTLTTIVVFIPFFLLSKQVQLLYSGLAITITAALAVSLVAALTLVPVLTQKFLKGEGSKSIQRYLVQLQAIYLVALGRVLERKARVLGAALCLFLAAAYVFVFHIPKNFMGGQGLDEFVIFVELPSGKRLDISDRIVKEVEAKVRSVEKISSSIRSISTRIEGWSSKLYVTMQPADKRNYSTEETIQVLRPLLQDIGRADEAFVYFSSPQEGQELTVNIYGQDEKATVDYAMQVAGLMEQVPQLQDTKIRYRPGRPEVLVRINPSRAALFGLNPSEVGWMLHAQTRGLRATYFRQAGEEVETIVRLRVEQRDSIDAIKTLPLVTPTGRQVPLEQIAAFDYSLAPSEIWRRDKKRLIQVTSNLSALSVEAAADKVKRLLKEIPFNTDYWAEIGGDYDDRIKAQREFTQAVLVTCLLIFAVLACLFESLLQPLLLFVSVPLSLIGIVAALVITRTPVTMGVMIGVLMTSGIAVNAAILFVDHVNKRKEEGETNIHRVLLEAGQTRMRPILMTTLTTILGLVPMALDQSNGSELWRPMAITTIGGLLSSMALTLLVLPALLAISERRGEPLARPSRAKMPLVPQFGRANGSPLHTLKISLLGFLLCFIGPTVKAEPAPLPPWVNQVVTRRVNDLLGQGKQAEGNKDFVGAIEFYLDAVRIAPTREDAKKRLLAANAQAMKAIDLERGKRRKKYLSQAQDRHRAHGAWKNALAGELSEAGRFLARGRLPEACDRYYRILEAAPEYTPAKKGLEDAQIRLRKKLDKGGTFSTDNDRRVAEGFWLYNQKKWLDASDMWAPVLSDATQIKKWGGVHLGEYAAKAKNNHDVQVHREKVDAALARGGDAFRGGRLDEAQQSFQSVLEMEPGNAPAKEYVRIIPGLLERARASVFTEVAEKELAGKLSDAMDFYLKGYYLEAEARLDDILGQEPQHVQALLLKEDIRKARGLAPLPSENDVLTEKEKQLDALYSDGIIAFAEGRMDQARRAWEDVLKENPNHPRAQRALAKISNEESPPQINQEVTP